MAKYALVIANDQYTDPGLAQLSAPGQDAEDFARALRAREIGAFDDVAVLVNQPEPAVREAIDEFFSQKKADDLLVLYFSGHGVRDEQGALYLALTNTNRARLRSTGIKSDFIRESMDQSRSRRQVLILDCCNSGAFAQGTKAAVGVTIGTASAFEGTGYGRVVLTATDSTQFAWEGDQVIGEKETQNSLFTHFLVKGLEGEADQDGDGKITVDELYDYAYEQIVSRTPRQTPGKWSYKQQGEIVLRQTPLEEIQPAALPADLAAGLESTYPSFREAAVRQLEELLKGKNAALARSARAALERLASTDDSRRVARLAEQVLEPYRQAQSKTAQTASHAGPLEGEKPSQPQAAASRTISEQPERILPNAPLVGTGPASPRIGWVTSYWITLIWAIAFLVGGILIILVNSAAGSSPDNLSGSVIPYMITGASGGLALAFLLRKAGALQDWKSMLLIPISFALGLLITTILGNQIGNEGGNSFAFIKGFGLGGAVGGCLGGLGIGLNLLRENTISGWKKVLIITAGYTLGFGFGFAMTIFVYSPIETLLGGEMSMLVSSLIGGAISGLIAGAGSVYWLRKKIGQVNEG